MKPDSKESVLKKKERLEEKSKDNKMTWKRKAAFAMLLLYSMVLTSTPAFRSEAKTVLKKCIFFPNYL